METKKVHTSRPSSPPCAACKYLKRRCVPSCIFKPHFTPHDLHNFASVHKVFGASNVAKLLTDVPLELRHDAVGTLLYEAAARIRDPVYGCVADIFMLQWKIAKLEEDLTNARMRLAQYCHYSSCSSLPESGLICSSPAIGVINGYGGHCGTSSSVMRSGNLVYGGTVETSQTSADPC